MSNPLSEVYVGGEVLRRLGDGAVEFSSAGAGNLTKRTRSPDASDLYAALAVNNALESIAAVPADDTLTHPVTTQITVTATYDGGATRDVTAECAFVSSDPTKATVSAAGLVTTVAAGTLTVTASYRGLKTDATPTITVS